MPQLGVWGGTPAPRKLRLASTMMASAKMNVACTITGAKVLGAMWRSMILQVGVPMAFAASTNCCSRRDKTAPRTTRTMRGVSTTHITRITLKTLAPSTAISASASSSEGNAINPSMNRIITLSARR